MSSANRYRQTGSQFEFIRHLVEASQAPVSWVEKEFAYSLWFGFLTISPSYELATKLRMKELSDDEQAQLPADIERVLAVFDDLGPVRGVNFFQWWPKARERCFGYPGLRPKIIDLTRFSSGSPLEIAQSLSRPGSRVESYFQLQDARILAIPRGIPKRQLVKQFSDWVDRHQADLDDVERSPPKYRLSRTRQDNKSLLGYLNLVWTRAAIRKPLWRVGYVAKFSSTYTTLVDAQAAANLDPPTEVKERLKILTSRGLWRAWMIAENAARGEFPSYEKCDPAVPFEAVSMYDLVRDQRRSEQVTDWMEMAQRVFGS